METVCRLDTAMYANVCLNWLVLADCDCYRFRHSSLVSDAASVPQSAVFVIEICQFVLVDTGYAVSVGPARGSRMPKTLITAGQLAGMWKQHAIGGGKWLILTYRNTRQDKRHLDGNGLLLSIVT